MVDEASAGDLRARMSVTDEARAGSSAAAGMRTGEADMVEDDVRGQVVSAVRPARVRGAFEVSRCVAYLLCSLSSQDPDKDGCSTSMDIARQRGEDCATSEERAVSGRSSRSGQSKDRSSSSTREQRPESSDLQMCYHRPCLPLPIVHEGGRPLKGRQPRELCPPIGVASS